MSLYELNKNNRVELKGILLSEFKFSHKVFGEGFYTALLSVSRTSGNEDILPVMVSERMVAVNEKWSGQSVKIIGRFRSYNKHEGNRNHLILSVFAVEFETSTDTYSFGENKAFFDGYICKPPVYRETPKGRKIADILLAVNRPYGKSDYIPCICWGRNALLSSKFAVGTRIQIHGRIQSRDYKKWVSETEIETRTAYEVSTVTLEVMKDDVQA